MSEYDSGTLSEHEAPPQQTPTSGSSQEYSPSSAERKQLQEVEKLFKAAKNFKSQYDVKWLDWYKMFRGKQWKEQRPTYRHSEVINLIFQNIQSQVPIITDTRPKFEFLPQEPSDFELSQILNEVAQADWMRNNWQYILTEVIYEGHFYGTGLSDMCWDPDENEIAYRSVDPFYFFPDPGAYDVNRNCEYCIEAEPMEISKVRRKWPEKGKYVKPDLMDLMTGSKTDLGPIRFKSPTDQRTIMEGSSTQDLGEKNKALVMTLYLRSCDDLLEEDNTKPPDPSGEIPLKYPNGKKIVVSNGVILEVGPNPYDDGEFPYQKWQNYILPREFWGMSEIEQLEGPQKTFNKLVSFALDVLTLMGNPVWIVDTNSDVDTDNLFNKPGLIIEKAPGSEVMRQEGVQLQPFVLQIIDRMKEWFDQVAGSNDITRGVNPGGVTAASAIADLQNAAQTRIRQKSRNLDCYLQDLGQQYVSRVFQFYSAPQVFRLTGDNGAEKYFKFHVSTDEAGNKFANVQNYNEQGQGKDIKQYQIRGEFDVRVTTGSSLPFSKAEKEDRLTKLFQLGIIDAQEVLKGLDYPNYQAIQQRMDQKAQAAAQAQSGGKPPAGPAPQG